MLDLNKCRPYQQSEVVGGPFPAVAAPSAFADAAATPVVLG